MAKPLLSAAKVSKRWDCHLFEDGGILSERNSRLLWRFEQFWTNTVSGIAMEGTSDSTAKATCTTRSGEWAMSSWSLRQSSHPRRAAPGWTLTMEIMTSEMKADQPEELKRVAAARQPSELEMQKRCQMNHAVFTSWCEVRVEAKGTGAQHRRQTIKELAKQEQDGPRFYSDFP